MPRKILSALATIALVALFGSGVARAAETILTINNLVTGETTHLSDEDLMALAQTSFETTTIWTEGSKEFSGPTLKAVLAAAGAEPSRLRVYAINDYNVFFEVEDIQDKAPILANRIDGEAFSVRHKGPIWIVFPYDQDPAFQSEKIFSLSVWQVNRIDILKE